MAYCNRNCGNCSCHSCGQCGYNDNTDGNGPLLVFIVVAILFMFCSCGGIITIAP